MYAMINPLPTGKDLHVICVVLLIDAARLLLGYSDDKKDELNLVGSGSGGLEELKSHLKPDQANFGYLRVTIGNDELSQRAKFVLVSWCGSEVKVMRKAKLSVHISDVKNVLKAFAVEIAASDMDDLDSKKVDLLVKKAMGQIANWLILETEPGNGGLLVALEGNQNLFTYGEILQVYLLPEIKAARKNFGIDMVFGVYAR
ncbi:hypothetical protein HK099_006769 [Clydaea vesicula]|uniref:ADF-H domain-containing protein n=1 Tax=Clydaea vesicula TaxID=447962 RepID=A0AAD5TXJ3_9FUNG|nr:hypothetical protein HK099_006769 [Clydaea vesicula]